MDSAHHTAIIYGDSIFLKGIADILRSLPDVEVIEEGQRENPAFTETHPSVILLDAAQTSLPQMEALMDSFPVGLCPPLFRLSARSQRLLVYSAQSLPAATSEDLTRALEKIFNPGS